MRIWMILTVIGLSALFGTTLASPTYAQEQLSDLAGQIKREAEHRSGYFRHNPSAPAIAMGAGYSLLIDMNEFALLTHRLSAQIEAEGGPSDLKCIFKGMSADIRTRIDALDQARTRADMARAFDAIVYLAGQAEAIAADPEAVSAGNSLPPNCTL